LTIAPQNKRRGISLVVVLCACLAYYHGSQAQLPDVLNRDNDDSARTVEEKQQALSAVLTAAQQARGTGDVLAAARFMNRAGRLQLSLNLLQDGLVTYQDTLNLLNQSTDSSPKIDTLIGIGTALHRLTKCDEAKTILNQAFDLSERSRYVAGGAEALLVLSFCQNVDDHATAIETANQALTRWQSQNNKVGMARAYSALGQYQLAQTNVTDATNNEEAALALWRELNVPEEVAQALIYLGYIEYRKGAWHNVLSYLSQAQGLIDEKAEPYKMGQINVALAETFMESGMPEVGLAKSQEALKYYSQAQIRPAMIDMTWHIGKANYLLGNYAEALSSLQQALADAETFKLPILAAFCNDFLGRTYLAMNQDATALHYFQLALDLYTKVGDPMEAARTVALMGQVYQQQGNIERALHSYQKALETFEALSDHLNESATLFAIGRLKMNQNHLDQAEDYLQRSIAVTEDIRRVSTSSDLAAAFSATVHERYESYIECLMRKHRAHPARSLDVRAFEASELARGRSLAEVLQATQTSLLPGLDPRLAKQEKELRQSLRVKEDYKVKLLSGPYRKEELEALDRELAGLKVQYKEVSESIRALYPSYEEIRRPTSWSLREIQQHVVNDDDTVLLEYKLGTEKSYVWAVTHNGIKSYELAAQAQINEAATKVHKLLTERRAEDESALTSATRQLGQMVLSPVAAELNKPRVIVVADGVLNYIPFQMLPTPIAVNEPLVARTEVINALSASILGQLRAEKTRRQAPTKVLAAFGDPVFASNYAGRKEPSTGEYIASAQPQADENWQRALRDIEPTRDSFEPSAIEQLFYSKRELANLRNVAGPESFVATGFEATREKLAATDLSGFAILHFATHGILDPKRPEKSGLLLSMVNRNGESQNGFVGLQDIYSLHAPVDLVVLSACRTGLGKDVRGEGLIGLTRGFMYAGASSVIASLWKVDDEATAELMKRFYANLLQRGMTPAAALRAAQNSIRQEPQWHSPYFWAAFTLQGEYRQVIKPVRPRFTGSTPRVVIAVSAILLLAILAWWYRRARRRVVLVHHE
jgi:CHAT domain-containing protein/tetratricopeptide (TPR) repeat protein